MSKEKQRQFSKDIYEFLERTCKGHNNIKGVSEASLRLMKHGKTTPGFSTLFSIFNANDINASLVIKTKGEKQTIDFKKYEL